MIKLGDKLWVEKYRPITFDDIIAPKALKKYLETSKKEGAIGNMLLYGPAGTGKTTTALAIVNELGAKDSYIHLNCSLDTGISDIRSRVQSFATTHSLYGECHKICILDEVDGLSDAALKSLKVFVEKSKHNCRFIFITNHVNSLSEPIISRTEEGAFSFGSTEGEKASLQKEMFKRCAFILGEEKVEFDNGIVWNVVQKKYPDFRSTIGTLQKAYKSHGAIDENASIHSNVSDMEVIIEVLKGGKYNKIRELASKLDSSFFTTVYDQIDDHVHDKCKPMLINTLNNYNQYHSACINKVLNISACMQELFKIIQWK